MNTTTFVITAEVLTASHRIPRGEAAFWWTGIQQQSSQLRAACVMELLWRHLRQRCKKSLAALAGRLWIRAAVCADGKSTAISEKTNLSARASYKVGRVRLLSNTRMPTRASLIDLKPFSVRLHVHGDLDFFLGRSRTRRSIKRSLSEKTSVKDVIESCGIPHPEVDLILVNGEAVDFGYSVMSDVEIELYPPRRQYTNFSEKRLQVTRISKFVTDGHLGKLTRNLRLLGFDVAYDPVATDRHLLDVMERENRALLTCDRRLLMHAIVKSGYCPRSQNSDEQTIEVIRRFDLFSVITPFTRCLRCNAPLEKVSKADIIEKLEPLTRIYYEEFRRCAGCGQLYWPGSHFEKLQKRIGVIHSRLTGKSDV